MVRCSGGCWRIRIQGLQLDLQTTTTDKDLQSELQDHTWRHADAHYEMKGLEIALEDLLEALLARCHDTTPVPKVLTKEADMLWAGISLVHEDLSALKMMRKGAMSS